MKISVLDDGHNHQNVLYQTDQTEHEKQLLWDHDLGDARGVHVPGRYVAAESGVHVDIVQMLRAVIHVRDAEVMAK